MPWLLALFDAPVSRETPEMPVPQVFEVAALLASTMALRGIRAAKRLQWWKRKMRAARAQGQKLF